MGQDNEKLQQWGNSVKARDLGFRKGYIWEEFRIGFGMWQWYTSNIDVPLKFLCWNLIPSVMVLGGGTSGRWLGHEEGASWIGLVPLLERPQESSLLPSTSWRHSKKTAVYESGGSHQTLNLSAPWSWDFPVPELPETNLCYLHQYSIILKPRQASNKDRQVFNEKKTMTFLSFQEVGSSLTILYVGVEESARLEEKFIHLKSTSILAEMSIQ